MTSPSEEARSILMALNTEEIFGSMSLDIQQMEYQGFCPETLIKSMWAKAKTKSITQDAFKRDLRTMAVLGLMRGSNVVAIKGKSTPDAVAQIVLWEMAYGLKSGKPTSSTTVTLVRVAACLVRPMSLAIHNGTLDISGAVSADNVVKGYPKRMAISSFGSLIPGADSIPEGACDLITNAFMGKCFLLKCHYLIFKRPNIMT